MPEPTSPLEAIASPLSLILEEATGGGDAVEVLLLSFTLDLGFFEQAALSAAQALGARVTVVGDAGVVRPDPRAVRRAGRGYLAGLAAAQGSFHPKLVVVAGPEIATVAVGSGNLTLAGWQDNHELWTVLRAGPDGGPGTLEGIARWLEALPGAVRFGQHVPEALARTAELLRAYRVTEPGPTVISPVFGPVIDQLPEGPVDELSVCCPFHDPGAVALTRLCERLQPAQLRVAIQPGLTVCDGPAIAGLVARYGGEVIEIDSARYRHGKLIEARVGGRRWALTGSANCSAAALLTATAAGGNVELSLLTDLDDTLMPEGATLGADALQAHVYRPRRIDRPGIILLGATRSEAGLEVLLARDLRWPARVELSPPSGRPDVWERVGDLPAGAHSGPVSRAVEGGGRLRVVADRPDGPVVSNIVFVVDPARAMRRHGGGTGPRRQTEPFDLFANTGLAERFVADLEALRAAGLGQGRPATAAATGRAASTAGTAAHVDHGNWEDYLDACAGRLGNSLLRFALGLPSLPGDDGAWSETVRAAWDEDLPDDGAGSLDSDDADDIAQEQAPAAVAHIPSLADQSSYTKGRYRRWAERLATAAPDLGTPERLVALRLVLWIIAADAWPATDTSWLAVLGQATEALGKAPEPPPQVEAATASLAAVAVSILRAHAPRTQSGNATRIYQRAVSAAGHLLAGTDAAYIEEYTRYLSDAFGPAVSPAVVKDVAAEIVQADPLADAARALEEHDIFGAHIHGRLLHTTKMFANPVLPALQAVGLAEDAGAVGAWAGTSESWALVIWTEPDLVVFTHGKTDRWFHYRLTGIYTPRACAYADKGIDRRFLVRESFGNQPPSEAALRNLASVELDAPAPPACG